MSYLKNVKHKKQVLQIKLLKKFGGVTMARNYRKKIEFASKIKK